MIRVQAPSQGLVVLAYRRKMLYSVVDEPILTHRIREAVEGKVDADCQ